MKKFLFLAVALAALAAWLGYTAIQNRGFTPWMSLAELNAFMATFESKVPGESNYWGQGHWIEAVEGRWKNGIPQYRIRYGDAPKNQGYWWYWFINQDENSFHDKVHHYADDGYVLAHYNKVVWPDGAPRFQAVWHKYGKKRKTAE